MTRSTGKPREDRVLVLAPVGRDAELTCSVLADAGIATLRCESMREVQAAIEDGAGTLFVSEEALSGDAILALRDAVGSQPPWSDLPIIVVASADMSASATRRTFERVEGLGHVTLLERPLRLLTLVSTVRTALLARQRQYQVRLLLERLEQGVEQRDQFLAMLAHELRNPLAAIVYATHLIPDGDDARRSREVIQRQTKHLVRLVDELLDVARITTGKIVLQKRTLDLRDLVELAVEALRPVSKAHVLEASFDPVTVPVDGDPVRLEQVVSNLVTNALKYTPQGGHVKVTVTRDAGDAVICVKDDGAGIDPALLPRVFDLFAQADTTLARAGGGLGIGLTVVRGLVELHGGRVRARSDGARRGSEFEVRLPIKTNGVVAVEESDRRSAAEPRTSGEPTKRRVLIIEDETDARELMVFLLESAGHSVRAAGDGIDGLDRAREAPPEIAIVDIGLPGMNGYDVARAIRRDLGREIYLVALTGYGQSQDRANAEAAGFDAHLTKPIDVDRLDRLVRDAPRQAALVSLPVALS